MAKKKDQSSEPRKAGTGRAKIHAVVGSLEAVAEILLGDSRMAAEISRTHPELCRAITELLRVREPLTLSSSSHHSADVNSTASKMPPAEAVLPTDSTHEEVYVQAPDSFFLWFDKHLKSKPRIELQQVLAKFAERQQGNEYGSYEKNVAFAKGLRTRMKQVGLVAVCPGPGKVACGKSSYFRCKKHRSYRNGVFYFEHADEGQMGHGWSAQIPQLRLVDRGSS